MNSKDRNFLSVTSVEQSKQLLDVGYSADMADMAWVKPNMFTTYNLFEKEQTLNFQPESYEVIPAWSLLRLIQLLPSSLEIVIDEETMECEIWNAVISKDDGISYVNESGNCIFKSKADYMTLKNSLVETFVWLANEGWYFKVEEEYDDFPLNLK